MKVYVDPYMDREHGVLKNLDGITDKEKLEKYEAAYTGLRMRTLNENPIQGKFDFKHLCKVHEAIFDKIYEWAGSPRIINMEKEEPVLGGLSIEYSEHENIRKDAAEVLKRMNNFKWDKMTVEERAREFSICMADLWKVHPFREGNTRTTVTFCCDFAEAHGFGLDRDLFKDNSQYVRNALVAASAKFSDMGDLSKPEYLVRIVKDGMERWEKWVKAREEKEKESTSTFSMKDYKRSVERSNQGSFVSEREGKHTTNEKDGKGYE